MEHKNRIATALFAIGCPGSNGLQAAQELLAATLEAQPEDVAKGLLQYCGALLTHEKSRIEQQIAELQKGLH